jgi:hypothetical protein
LNVLIDRFAASLTANGDTMTIGSTPVKAFIQPIAPGEAKIYVAATTIDGGERPVLQAMIAPSVSAALGQNVAYDGQNYKIEGLTKFRWAGETYGKQLILCPVI